MKILVQIDVEDDDGSVTTHEITVAEATHLRDELDTALASKVEDLS